MADYPTLDAAIASQVEIQDGKRFERADDGTARAVVTWSGEKRTWRLVHLLDATDAATLYAHYAAHIESTFNFDDPETATTYAVMYRSPPAISYPAPDLMSITVVLEEI